MGEPFNVFEPDLVNPLRGQYENLLMPLFPQGNPAQAQYPAWPGTRDVSIRIDWRDLQPLDPRNLRPNTPDDQKYDFAALDRVIADAAQAGRRIGFRITAFNSCCETSYPNNVDIAVPDWLGTVVGATRAYVHDGVTYVIPEWNSQEYLSYFRDLLSALGRRYDRDERVAVFEMSGYGDFSENNVAFMRDTLGIAGPEPGSSEAQLGYFSQYRDQFITKTSIDFLVAANLGAFPNTRLISSPDNPEMVKRLFRDDPSLRHRRNAVGIRADGLGVYRPIPAWAEDPHSHYVRRHDPIVDTLTSRYRIAPIVTEWMPQVPVGVSARDYYLNGLTSVVNDHVSMTASTGFPGQTATEPMPVDEFDIWARANKFSGYRYSVRSTGEVPTVAPGTPIQMPLVWTNFGSAPLYENWQPEFDVVSESNEIVESVSGSVDLHGMVVDQHFDSATDLPTAAARSDTLLIPGQLARGTYSVRARVMWNEHKPNASYTVNYPPLQLDQPGRDDDGSYPIGTFIVD